MQIKTFGMLFTLLALAACSGSSHRSADDNDGGSGSGGKGGGGTGGKNSGTGGKNSGTGGKNAGTGGKGSTGNGSGGSTSHGDGGSGGKTSGSGGKNGGTGGKGSGGTGGSGDIDDGGTQSTATKCRAPVAAKNPGNACPSSDPVALKATLVKDGFDTPVFVTYLPNDRTHLLVVERAGKIRRLDLKSGDVSLFLDVSDRSLPASGDNEFGLLGLAVHPDFPNDPRIFINYVTDPNTDDANLGYYGHTNVSSFEAAVDGTSADASTEMVLINYGQPESNHNGGMLAFGPDGCLFVGAGDGGNSNDTGTGHAAGGNGQALDTPLAKILRIDVDDPSSSAPGNMSATNPHIWDYGIRNPWRFSFDRDSGDLYIGDVGQGAVEEVDVEAKGVGHHNYGWPIGEGSKCLGGGTGCNLTDLVQPVDDYPHVADHIDCVIGGYVYRGSKIPSLKGWYVYGDNGPDGLIRTFVWDGTKRCKDTIVLSTRDGIHLDSDIVSFGEDHAGELYVMSHTSVYHLEAK